MVPGFHCKEHVHAKAWLSRATGNSGNGTENGNRNGQILMHIYTRVKPLSNDHLCTKHMIIIRF